MRSIFSIICLCLMLGGYSCTRSKVFDQSPTERIQSKIKVLKDSLTLSAYAWEAVYFPQTDSLLFNNTKLNIVKEGLANRLGYGGYTFILRFDTLGSVEMLSDMWQSDYAKSEYTISHSSAPQLSFTTSSLWHNLLSLGVKASANLLYRGQDIEHNLLFKTTHYLGDAKECIILKPIKTQEDLGNKMKQIQANKLFFEQMSNPQLHIYKGARSFFKSEVFLKSNSIVGLKYKEETLSKRYYLFLEISKANPDVYQTLPLESNAIGSGYTATSSGLTFYSGLRYNKSIVFHEFMREGDRFISKQLDIYGEPTGYEAVIYDLAR